MMHVILGSPLPDTTDTDTIRIRFDTRLSYDSAVTETIPEPETAVFFWSQVNTVLPSDVCVYIRYKAKELVQARRLKIPSKSSASAKFTYLIPEQLCACFKSASKARVITVKYTSSDS